MQEQEFWAIIEKAKAAAGNDCEQVPEALRAVLSGLTSEQVAAYDKRFHELVIRAYRWDLWAAAYIIHGGCSDDGFTDFRAGLIGMGEKAYRDALANPESLADLDQDYVENMTIMEEIAYVGAEVYEEMTGNDMPDHELDYPADPAGEPWEEDAVDEIHPKLAAIYS